MFWSNLGNLSNRKLKARLGWNLNVNYVNVN